MFIQAVLEAVTFTAFMIACPCALGLLWCSLCWIVHEIKRAVRRDQLRAARRPVT